MPGIMEENVPESLDKNSCRGGIRCLRMAPVEDFEATFTVSIPPAEVWRQLVPGRDERLAGFESKVTPLEVDAGRRFRVSKDEMPCAGTEIVFTLEADGSGTRINVVQSGFGDFPDRMRGAMEVGW